MVARLTIPFLERMRTTLRGRNAIFHVFELWVGLAGMISGFVFFVQPSAINEDALSHIIGRHFSAAWVIGYMIAGILIWFGLLRPSPRWETVGLWLLGGATAANGIAIESIFGWRGVPTAATLLALTVASWLRAVVVYVDTCRLADVGVSGGAG